MKKFINKSKAGKPVCFIDGFTIRHGVALEYGRQTVCVWEDDLFTSPAGARAVLNKLVG